MADRWATYLCTDPRCGNQLEAKRNPHHCDLCGAPTTKRPVDDARYDYDAQQWIVDDEEEEAEESRDFVVESHIRILHKNDEEEPDWKA